MRHSILAIAMSMAVIWHSPGALAFQYTTVQAPAVSTTDGAALRSAVIAGNYTSRLSNVSRKRCPASCSSTGVDPSQWFVYHSVDRLDVCNQTMLLNFALFNQLDDPVTRVSIAACSADLAVASSGASTTNTALCHSAQLNQTERTSSLQLASSGSSSSAAPGDVVNALEQLQALSTLSEPGCNETINFAYTGTAAIGVYVGSGLADQGVISSVLGQLATQLQNDGTTAKNLVVQLCDNSTARYSLGVIINTNADLSFAQLAVQSWKNSSCFSLSGGTASAWQNITYLAPSLLRASNNTTSDNSTSLEKRPQHSGRKLLPRTTCTTIRVVSGDTCATLATQCGITAAQFTTYNPSSTECSTLTVGEYVCCSAGTLPDLTPSPYANGTCYTYAVVSGDSCSALAASYDITVADIGTWNTDTWGWTGCSDLLVGYNICLSSGYAPMPTTVANAVCGPQVNGTAVAPVGTDLTTLNECPLNACCDIWGQCGTTTEFCTPSNSTTRAPGTAAAGQNGCISNCGTEITVSTAPAETFAIAYFEGFDWQRPCLTMSVEDVDITAYTHIHFAFATLNADYSINTTTISSQLPFLQGMTGIKRIISIGGWSFSTDPSTYTIFRTAVSSEANRETLISNVITFLNDYDLDGVDWDWEYPDEPDIPGIPAGTAADAIGYFLLLDELRTAMPSGKTISLTLPASFWYLQYFPIAAISAVVDYVVFMTYDLHGQWDYGNAFSDTGCSAGDCLRSHINITETINALSMITKAGVPSNMVVVGVSSYGRSFQMTTAGCWTEECTFTGPLSGALPGPCTGTAGYISDYEINSIASSNPTVEVYFDDNSYSNIVVYNETQWVAYMNDSNKATRKSLYADLTFLGSADWAVDLQSIDGDGAASSGSSSDNETVYINPNIWSSATMEVTALPGMTLIWPPMPLASTTTISFPLWTTTISYSSLTTVTSVADGSTSIYPSYIFVSWLTILTIPSVKTTAIPVWGVTLGSSSTQGAIYLTSSVQPEPFAITFNPVVGGTTNIVGATTTSTTSGGVFVWGILSYFQPTQTETLGGSTTIIGGTTLAPTAITVTPNPYPTTVPSTTDPVVNSKPIAWTSAKPPGPTSLPGCDGCGLPCLIFCDSGCPFCPPWIFGSQAGSGGDDDDSSSTSTASETTDTITYTALFDTADIDDTYPTGFAALSDYSSFWSYEGSWLAPFLPSSLIPSGVGPTMTTTATVVTPPPTITPTPTTTPSAACYFWDEGWGYTFEIFSISGWATDGGSSLHTQEDGCGALTGWSWTAATSSDDEYVYFNLPFFINGGCVERAIVSAGGPKISCKGQGFGKRSGVAAPPVFTAEEKEAYESFYANATTWYPYVPMVWTGVSTAQSLQSMITAAPE